MKKIYLILLVISLLNTNLNAQNEIKASWRFDISDSTIKKTERRYWGLPMIVLETKKNDLILVSQQFMGWTLENIDRKTGNIIWKNARNQDYPDSSKKMYIIDNIFERKDGNLEILGTKTNANDFVPAFSGFPVRSIYNSVNGKEILFTQPKFDFQKDDYPMYYGDVSRRFIPNGNNYLVACSMLEVIPTFSLRTLDTTMVMKDTLGYIMSPFPKNSVMKLTGGSFPNTINNNIYFVHQYYGKSADTTLNKLLFVGINKQGKTVITKDISKSLYYFLDYRDFAPAKDGFLVSGMVDTSNILKKGARNIAIVNKIDTLGNTVWNTILQHPEKKVFQTVYASEDKQRGGVWAFTGHPDEPNPYLFYISKEGKSKLIGKIFIPNNTEKFFSAGLWSLQDGSVLLSYRYQKCDNDPKFIYCWGVAKLEKNKLDIILENETELTTNDEIGISIFPNPAHDKFNISLRENNSGKISIVNQLGQVFYSQSFSDTSEIVVNVNDLPSSIYFVKIDMKDKGTVTKKIFVN